MTLILILIAIIIIGLIIICVPTALIILYFYVGIRAELIKHENADYIQKLRMAKERANIDLIEARSLKVRTDQQVLRENRIPNLTYQAMKLQEQIDTMRRKAGKRPINFTESDNFYDLLDK